jgi:hypothetical protein
MIVRLIADAVALGAIACRPWLATSAENLVLRRQLALFKERGIKPWRIDAATRISLAALSRLCDWRSCLTLIRPQTVIRWHRAGWRILWRYKSLPGRPRIPAELRQLIRRMAADNPTWGLSPKPRARDHRLRFPRGGHGNFPPGLRVCRHAPWLPTVTSSERDLAPGCRLDPSVASGDYGVRRLISLPAARSRFDLCEVP